MEIKRLFLLWGIINLLIYQQSYAQKWYTHSMEANTVLADSSNNWAELQKSQDLFLRIHRSFKRDWLPPYYIAFESLRMATLQAKAEISTLSDLLGKAEDYAHKADTLSRFNKECTLLLFYSCLLREKLNCQPNKVITNELSTQVALLLPNPRAKYTLALYNQLRGNRKLALQYLEELLKECPLERQPDDYKPFWGCKSAAELMKEL